MHFTSCTTLNNFLGFFKIISIIFKQIALSDLYRMNEKG